MNVVRFFLLFRFVAAPAGYLYPIMEDNRFLRNSYQKWRGLGRNWQRFFFSGVTYEA
jgi:hypothetical protein